MNEKIEVTISGHVQKANEKGVLINGEWKNFSKFMKEPIPPLATGDFIEIICKDQWIQKIKKLASFEEMDISTENSSTNGDNQLPVSPKSIPYSNITDQYSQKQRTITRLAVMNTAVEMLKTHNKPITIDALFKVATQLYEWATTNWDDCDNEIPIGGTD